MLSTTVDTIGAVTRLMLAVALVVIAVAVAAALLVLVTRRAFGGFRLSAGKGGVGLELNARDLASKVDEVATKVGAVEEVARQVAADTAAINRAVNHVPEGAPTLIARVGRLELTHQWLADAVHTIAARIGIDVSPPPKHEDLAT